MDHNKTTIETYNKVALAYQEKFMNLDLYNDTYDLFCKHINNANAKIFEMGCGPGNITRYLLSQHPHYKICAIDLAPNMVKLARINNPTANFSVMDCRDIDKITDKYDAIMCGFCMPYLSKEDCTKLIKDSACLLNAGGIVYLSAIEDDYSKSGYETSSSGNTMYVYYHEYNTIRSWLEENNFNVVEVARKAYAKSDGSPSTHIIFIAKK